MTIKFTKMSGAGNDFILIDNRLENQTFNESQIAKWCKRGTGIGADGFILVEKSTQHDFTMRYFNADGKPGSLCGNGARCISQYAVKKGISKSTLRFEANDEVYHSEILSDGLVKVQMNSPNDWREKKLIEELEAYFVNTGSPHAIIYVDDIDSVDVVSTGKKIRNHTEFSPEGTNVNFLKINPDSTIRIRTYERGVENETLACGTGCVAAALMSYKLGKIDKTTVDLRVASGEIIQVVFESTFNEVFLIGPAEIVFEGELSI